MSLTDEVQKRINCNSFAKKVLRSTVFLLTIFTCVYGQNASDTINHDKISELIVKAKNKNITKSEIKTLRDSTHKIQNEGFNLEEKSHNYKASLEKINYALNVWQILGDTLNEANIQKYKGYLLANLDDFPGAKREIFSAINLFRLKHFYSGEAVCQFDLSKVYLLEHNTDSALFWAKIAQQYWQSKKDTFRMVTSNNQLINLFVKTNKIDSAAYIQKESEELLKNKEIHWRPTIDFYFLSSEVFRKQKKDDLFKTYQNLYRSKLDQLKKEGVIVKSDYDAN